MSLSKPSSCAAGGSYLYGPSFSSTDWNNGGGAFSFGATIDSPGGGADLTQYAYIAVTNIAELHIEMIYDYQNSAANSIGGLACLDGIGVAPASYAPLTHPYAQSPGNSARGAWAHDAPGGQYAFIGRNTVASFSDATLVTGTPYLNNKITIDVSPNLGSFTYNITVRLQMPSQGIDHTEVLALANSAASGYIVLSGPYGHVFGYTDTFTVTKLYMTSPYSGLASECAGLAPPQIGLAHGFEGFVSIFEDATISGTTHSYPQPLYVDQDSLSFNKEIVVKGNSLGDGRVTNYDAVVYKAPKPQGGVTFQFRSSDILKPLYSHFQLGTASVGTSPYRYSFYPKKNPLDYSQTGTTPRGPYGTAIGKAYSVSILKRVTDKAEEYDGTNSFFFKHAICDKLGFSLSVGDDAKAHAQFKFRDLDPGTAVTFYPNSNEVGTYATTPSFVSWMATVTLNGNPIELSSFGFNSDQGSQEFSRVGRQAPENYNFAQYKLQGEFSFDLPFDALKEVGSMFGSQVFSLTATMFNGTADRVIFELPNCRRMPFDYMAKSGAESVKASIPFEAFERNGTYPIRVTVDTTYNFPALL